MSKKGGSRKWFCRVSQTNETLRGLYKYDFNELYQKLADRYSILFALHDKDLENVHCHIVIQNRSTIEFETIKNLIPYGDIEKQRGTNKECYEYCLHLDPKSLEREKEQYDDSCLKTNIEDFEVWKKLDNKLGARNDLVQMVEDLKNGATKKDIKETYPSQYVRYSNAVEKIQQEYMEERVGSIFRNLEVVYIHGSTGVGKTRYVMEKHGYQNVFHISSYGYGMFDSYKGQDVMLFDEFRSSIPIAQMLCYLDGYPLYLPARYNNKMAMYTKVYIISNIPISAQYLNVQRDEPKTYDAFLRRINAVYDFDKSKTTPISTDSRLIPIDVDITDIF